MASEAVMLITATKWLENDRITRKGNKKIPMILLVMNTINP
jgi:hypothetical protein